jgi:putative nucleotidyltransferase with HDIG domain
LIFARFAISDGEPVDVQNFPPLPLEPEGQGLQSPVIRSGVAQLVRDSLPIADASDSLYYVDANGHIYERDEPRPDLQRTRSMMILPILFQQKVRGVIQVQSYRLDAYDEDDLQIAESLVAQIAVASNNAILYEQSIKEIEYRKQVEASLLQISSRQEKIAAMARDLAATMDLQQIYRISKKYIEQLIDCTMFAISYPDELSGQIAPAFLSLDRQELDLATFSLDEFSSLADCQARIYAIQDQSPKIFGDLKTINEIFACNCIIGRHEFNSAFFIPMVVEGQVTGMIDLMSARKNAYKEDDREWLSVVANLIGMVHRNASLYHQTQRRMEELAAMHEIESAVIMHAEIGNTFDTILDQIKKRFEVDAANILLFDPVRESLNYIAGFGFYNQEIEQTQLKLGEGLAGKCALERRLVFTPAADGSGLTFANEALWQAEGFVTGYNLPLIVNSKLLGVLAVFKRSLFRPDKDWLLFFEVLAGQIAIVVDYLNVIRDLQKANEDLLKAYDATIEGWSQAMDLRDHETEGHTQRVTQLTLDLAKSLGLDDEDLVHIRRGALLHDIGKLGVPDSILLKAGPLTDEEWVMMKKHPVYAYQMLEPIEYLNPALDIPYRHHERWDGSGYPHGLSGEEIPLAARIFAIVDVWDALTSDRPYRAAWSTGKVMAYIQEQAGVHFDPKLVELFVQYMQACQDDHPTQQVASLDTPSGLPVES